MVRMEQVFNEQHPHEIAQVVEPRADAVRPEENRRRARIVAQMSIVGVGGNIALAAFKFAAGFLGGSVALISDAVHSASDVLATAVAYVGERIARRDPDIKHPYGHERFEQLASLLLAVILVAAGFGIGVQGILAIAGQAVQSPPATISYCLTTANLLRKITKHCFKTTGTAHLLRSGSTKLSAGF